MWRNRTILTKIIATIGGASASTETLAKLVEAGASVFRLNFSHGDFDSHLEILKNIRQVERELNRPIGVMGDLSGPKMRVGQVIEGGVMVETGQDVIFQREPIVADGLRFSTTYQRLVDDVEPGQKILVNDGAIRMLVVSADLDEVVCRVTMGGLITSGKGINLPNSCLSIEAITEKDWTCLEWAIENELDLIALSFVRHSGDIERLRQRMVLLTKAKDTRPLPIIAKIERPEALENIDGIITVSDLIMVARGDLGVELDLAEVPSIQKRLVDRCRDLGKPCIVATQMLESMIENSTPTRAEASDVANAILDGAGAIMLSGETAVGRYPVLAVDTMARIAGATEEYLCSRPDLMKPPKRLEQPEHWTGALAHGAWTVARDVRARLIFSASQTGVTALHLSQANFQIPIVIGSNWSSTLRRVTILRGVTPVRMERCADLDEFTRYVDDLLVCAGWAEDGQPMVLLAGDPRGDSGSTNSLAVHYIGSETTGFRGR